MAKHLPRVIAALIAYTLLILEVASCRSGKAESTLVLAQGENLDLSICYMRLADGRQMDLRGICGKTLRDRASPLNAPSVKSPLLDDDADESVSNRRSPVPPPASTTGASAVSPPAAPPVATPISPNSPGGRQSLPTSTPTASERTAPQTPPPPAVSQPLPRVIVQPEASQPQKRDD